MRRSSIGSPFVSLSRGLNRSRFFFGESTVTTPPMVSACLSAFAPKAFAAHGIPQSMFSATARVFSCPATSGDLAVLTTCSTVRGGERVKLWTEFALLSPSLISAWLNSLEAVPLPDKSQVAQSYRLWTSREISLVEAMHRQSPSFAIAQGLTFHGASEG